MMLRRKGNRKTRALIKRCVQALDDVRRELNRVGAQIALPTIHKPGWRWRRA